MQGSRFRVQGSGCRVQGLGFRVSSVGFSRPPNFHETVWGLGCLRSIT